MGDIADEEGDEWIKIYKSQNFATPLAPSPHDMTFSVTDVSVSAPLVPFTPSQWIFSKKFEKSFPDILPIGRASTSIPLLRISYATAHAPQL